MKRYAYPPLPPYVDELELLSLDEEMDETESKNPLYDICFHLLKLYSDRFVMASSFFADFFINDAVHSCVFMQADFKFFPLFRHYSLQQLLDPSTVTADHLDYRLSWHLWNVLQALNYNHLSTSCQGLLHVSYAAQLESAGLWDMAIFVLLHIPDSG